MPLLNCRALTLSQPTPTMTGSGGHPREAVLESVSHYAGFEDTEENARLLADRVDASHRRDHDLGGHQCAEDDDCCQRYQPAIRRDRPQRPLTISAHPGGPTEHVLLAYSWHTAFGP